jgi:hypothetical protein
VLLPYFFFKIGQELYHLLRRKRRSDYKLHLQNLKRTSRAQKQHTRGELRTWLRVDGLSPSPHNHPHQVTATPTKNRHDTDAAKKTGHKDELQEGKICILQDCEEPPMTPKQRWDSSDRKGARSNKD